MLSNSSVSTRSSTITSFSAAPRETLIALRHELKKDILNRIDQGDLLLSIKTLADAVESSAKLDHLAQEYQKNLAEPSKSRLERILKQDDRVFLCRQQVLSAFREAILYGTRVEVNQIHPLAAAILLSHAVLDADDVLGDANGERIAGLPARLTMHLVANQDFNSKVDVIARFDRAIRLWRDFGPQYAARIGNQDPHAILMSQTGMEIEDMLAVAFGVWSHDLQWNPNSPRPLARELNPRTDPELVAAFMNAMSANVETFANELRVQRSDWDVLPFEIRPVLEVEGGWILIDVAFLMDRVTSGLFYFVFDYLKSIDIALALEWSKVWGSMVEDLVRSNVALLCQASSEELKPMYNEADLALAYPKGGGRADIVVDFDETIVAFEVVSGHLKVETRLGLELKALNDDMERIVYKKLRQLDGTASNVVSNPTALLGSGADMRAPKFQPVVVAAGGFPFNFATSKLIEEYVTKKGLFQQEGVLPVAIIDMSELEIIEALAEDGERVDELIRHWKSSGDRHQSLRNWLIVTRGFVRARPESMDARVHLLTDDFSRRLNIEDVPASKAEGTDSARS